MTIPSISGNGDFSDKIHINNNLPNINQNNLAPQTQLPIPPQQVSSDTGGTNTLNSVLPQPPVSADDAKLHDNSADKLGPGEVKTDKALKEEKEYSINQFRLDYNNLLKTKVMPIVSSYESERKKRLTMALIADILIGLCAAYILFFVDGRGAGNLFWALIAAIIAVWAYIKKTFEKKIKKLVMPTLMQAIPGFYWQEASAVSSFELDNSMIFPSKNKYADKKFDDCFVGEYRNVPVAVSEYRYVTGSGKNKQIIFQGAVIKIKMNKNFEGTTIIRPRRAPNGNFSDLKKSKLEEVKLEDPVFCKEYVVYANDQIESRYLITTGFLERFTQIKMAFKSKFSYCVFYKDSVYIAPYSGCDLFNLCSLIKPMTDRKQFDALFDQFVSVLELVDYFKLDRRLGL